MLVFFPHIFLITLAFYSQRKNSWHFLIVGYGIWWFFCKQISILLIFLNLISSIQDRIQRAEVRIVSQES
jgi:hypothetical protein